MTIEQTQQIAKLEKRLGEAFIERDTWIRRHNQMEIERNRLRATNTEYETAYRGISLTNENLTVAVSAGMRTIDDLQIRLRESIANRQRGMDELSKCRVDLESERMANAELTQKNTALKAEVQDVSTIYKGSLENRSLMSRELLAAQTEIKKCHDIEVASCEDRAKRRAELDEVQRQGKHWEEAYRVATKDRIFKAKKIFALRSQLNKLMNTNAFLHGRVDLRNKAFAAVTQPSWGELQELYSRYMQKQKELPSPDAFKAVYREAMQAKKEQWEEAFSNEEPLPDLSDDPIVEDKNEEPVDTYAASEAPKWDTHTYTTKEQLEAYNAAAKVLDEHYSFANKQSAFSNADVQKFCGYLSAAIEELHNVEVPRIGQAWEGFKSVLYYDKLSKLPLTNAEVQELEVEIRRNATFVDDSFRILSNLVYRGKTFSLSDIAAIRKNLGSSINGSRLLERLIAHGVKKVDKEEETGSVLEPLTEKECAVLKNWVYILTHNNGQHQVFALYNINASRERKAAITNGSVEFMDKLFAGATTTEASELWVRLVNCGMKKEAEQAYGDPTFTCGHKLPPFHPDSFNFVTSEIDGTQDVEEEFWQKVFLASECLIDAEAIERADKALQLFRARFRAPYPAMDLQAARAVLHAVIEQEFKDGHGPYIDMTAMKFHDFTCDVLKRAVTIKVHPSMILQDKATRDAFAKELLTQLFGKRKGD